MKIKMTVGDLRVEGELDNTTTGQKVAEALPIRAPFSTWGDEIYFDIPVVADQEVDARAEVEVGELGYWPVGHAFCIFFGRTPASIDDKPRAASPVNILGRVLGDATEFRAVQSGAQVRLVRSDGG